MESSTIPCFGLSHPTGKSQFWWTMIRWTAGKPITVFESGAILLYLAERQDRFLPHDVRRRSEVLQWLFWQTSGLSPMSGQAVHFVRYAPEDARAYGTLRYKNEVWRLYEVLNKHLKGREFMCGEYSLADIGTYPWAIMYDRFDFDISELTEVERWCKAIAARPAVSRAYNQAQENLRPTPPPSKELLESLFGKTAELLTRPDANFIPKTSYPKDR